MMTHPALLARLVEEYEMESELRAADPHGPVRQQMEDVVYTLCVSTGTRDIEAALAAARERLRTGWPGEPGDGATARGGRTVNGAAGRSTRAVPAPVGPVAEGQVCRRPLTPS
ncbi:DUF5133 domain-containing protein [Streptomyces lavendulae]|uniref:DUF5133 domain-containing protein n=2 Tax=Streptomyces lavendulae TaxID=1914 RepID=UPI0024A2774A|nr:hypothetical protein Slala05_77720 [Streptomyces lavendulae subsp. lavendulae]